MQQKAQIINTLLHEPELVIIDEPFTALDPINVQLVKDLMRELHRQGVTIIMSTHQMHQVEELCDRILLIDRGRDVLYGSLNEVRRRFSGHEVLVQAEGGLPDLPGIERSEAHNSAVKLFLSPDTTPQVLLRSLLERDVVLDRFEIAVPSLDEIFIQVVAEGRKKP
jgi:ABC-2 type transport system ATP-binding protein